MGFCLSFVIVDKSSDLLGSSGGKKEDLNYSSWIS